MTDQPAQTEQAPAQVHNVPDTVTQLQKCLDQYLIQLFASIKYVNTRHPLSAPIEPLSLPSTQSTATGPSTTLNGGPGSQSTLPASQPQTATPSSLHSLPSTQAAGPSTQSTTTSHHPSSSSSSSAHYIPFTDPQHDPTDSTNPSSVPAPGAEDKDGNTATQPVSPSHQPVPVPEFRASLRELAQDLVAKQKQIEGLAVGLPGEGGEGRERERQERRLKELEEELGRLGTEVERAGERREELVRRVDGVMGVWAQGRGV